MAYGLRIRIEYKDINEVLTRINIYQKDYAGSADVRYANAGIKVDYGDQESETLPLVYGSSCTIYFDAEFDYEFKYLFTADARKHLVEIEKNSSLFFSGYAEPGSWSEPLTATPYPVQLTAYDGLGLLKDEDFLDTDKEYYEGFMTPLAILQLVLSKTGLSLALNTAVGFRPFGATTAANALTQVLKDVVTYRGLSCYEVLEKLFLGCRIMQRGGEWYCVSNDKWAAASFDCYAYFSNGIANGTKTITTELTGFWVENSADLNFMPAIKQVTIKQNYGLKANLIENQNFEEFENGNFDGWTPYGATVPEQRTYDEDGNKYVYLPGTEYQSAWTDPRSNGIVSNGYAVKQTTNIPRISVDYAVIGLAGKAANVFIGIKLITTTTKYCVIANLLEDNKTVEYIWDERPTVQPLGCPPTVVFKTYYGSPNSYFIDKTAVEAFPFDEVTSKFKKLEFSLKEGIPADGTLYFYLYLPNTNAPTHIFGTCFRKVTIHFNDENEGDLPASQELIVINSLDNNYVPEDMEVVNGDIPDITNNTAMYEGGFILNDGSGDATLLWQLDGDVTGYDYAEFIGRFFAAQMKLFRQAYQVRLADVIPGTAIKFTDPDNSNLVLMEAGVTYDDRMQATEGRYIEVVAWDVDGFAISRKIDYKKQTTDNKPATGAGNYYATDEKVGMMTSLFEIVNQPGYISADEFIQDIDPVSGRAVIRTKSNVQVGRLTGLASGTVTVTFTKAFEEIPVGLPRVYRMVADGGVYLMQDVLFSYPSTNWLTATGFTITIDSAEALSGIIVLYTFTESNYTA